jgi:hypothetical protein
MQDMRSNSNASGSGESNSSPREQRQWPELPPMFEIIRRFEGGTTPYGALLCRSRETDQLVIGKIICDDEEMAGQIKDYSGVVFRKYKTEMPTEPFFPTFVAGWENFPKTGCSVVFLAPYCNGGSLRDMVNFAKQHKLPIPENMAWSISRQILRALTCMADRRTYHGDAHLGNLLLRFPSFEARNRKQRPEVVWTDFHAQPYDQDSSREDLLVEDLSQVTEFWEILLEKWTATYSPYFKEWAKKVLSVMKTHYEDAYDVLQLYLREIPQEPSPDQPQANLPEWLLQYFEYTVAVSEGTLPPTTPAQDTGMSQRSDPGEKRKRDAEDVGTSETSKRSTPAFHRRVPSSNIQKGWAVKDIIGSSRTFLLLCQAYFGLGENKIYQDTFGKANDQDMVAQEFKFAFIKNLAQIEAYQLQASLPEDAKFLKNEQVENLGKLAGICSIVRRAYASAYRTAKVS